MTPPPFHHSNRPPAAADCGLKYDHDPHTFRTERGKLKACDGSTSKRDTPTDEGDK